MGRWYPIAGESFLASIRRLNEFGEQWPTFQQVHKKSGRSSALKNFELEELGGNTDTLDYVSDEWSSAVVVMMCTMAYVSAGISGVFGKCYTDPVNCNTVYFEE